MVELLSVSEGEPEEYPELPSNVSADAAAEIGRDVVWQRIEAWITHRWKEREVVWIVQGPGCFELPLKPATVDTSEVWNDNSRTWETVTLNDAPTGFDLDAKTYRITATVGSTGEIPASVWEASLRLAEYLYQAQQDPAQGHTDVTDGDFTFRRSGGWAARAIHYSGAGDLLRPWR